MLKQNFKAVYSKFKMHFYHDVFNKLVSRTTRLTTVETFCMEIINLLDRPTVSEFSRFASLSSANAADKVNKLVEKGYIDRVQEQADKRIFYLIPTQKYYDNYNLSDAYLDDVLERLEKKITPEQAKVLNEVLEILDNEVVEKIDVRKHSMYYSE